MSFTALVLLSWCVIVIFCNDTPRRIKWEYFCLLSDFFFIPTAPIGIKTNHPLRIQTATIRSEFSPVWLLFWFQIQGLVKRSDGRSWEVSISQGRWVAVTNSLCVWVLANSCQGHLIDSGFVRRPSDQTLRCWWEKLKLEKKQKTICSCTTV